MIDPPIPDNEDERLRVLALYRILDTAADKLFDDLAQLAATICDTPISLITLVDRDRQWFKSRLGLDSTETPRRIAFCSYAILGDDLMIVEDATVDARFAENPLVTSDPSIRFYAGAPLIVEGGHALGTLCVIDREPRRLSSQQLEALRILRRAVVSQLELRRSQVDMKALGKLLPMCAWCRSIRTDDGAWEPLHEYVMNAVPVSHGMCPRCVSERWHD